MSSKAFFIIGVSVLLIKSISGQCIGSVLSNGLSNGLYGLAGNGCSYSAGLGYTAPASSGGDLAVSSASPLAPNGIAVASANAIDGTLTVAGSLPFLGAVGFEGQLPSAGTAGVSYSCGNGKVGIVGNGATGLGYNIGASSTNTGLANLDLANRRVGPGRYGCSSSYTIPTSSSSGFTVSSASPVAPNGIAVVSENAIEGALAVSGALPFLGAAGLEGQLPSAGAAGVSYSCGNSNVGIASEGHYRGNGYGVGLVYGTGGCGYGFRY